MATTLTNQMERDAAIAESREACVSLLQQIGGGNTAYPPEFHCVLWADALIRVLKRRSGADAILQAGTCGWPRLNAEQDDGRPETHTHFSHVFNPAAAVAQVRAGVLPEMHAWVVIRDRDLKRVVLIDPTTGGWPDKCRLVTGLDWPGLRPPPYLWCPVLKVPPRAVYRPHEEAILWALAFAESARTGRPLTLASDLRFVRRYAEQHGVPHGGEEGGQGG